MSESVHFYVAALAFSRSIKAPVSDTSVSPCIPSLDLTATLPPHPHPSTTPLSRNAILSSQFVWRPEPESEPEPAHQVSWGIPLPLSTSTRRSRLQVSQAWNFGAYPLSVRTCQEEPLHNSITRTLPAPRCNQRWITTPALTAKQHFPVAFREQEYIFELPTISDFSV